MHALTILFVSGVLEKKKKKKRNEKGTGREGEKTCFFGSLIMNLVILCYGAVYMYINLNKIKKLEF